MAEVIQFNCPSCGMVLRMPLALAGQEGPCPGCRQEITAPDPDRGMGARLTVAPAPVPEPKPIKPFAESPPLVPREQEVPVKSPEPVAQGPVSETEPQARVRVPKIVPAPPPPKRGGAVFACLLTGLAGLALGYALGVRAASPAAANFPLVTTAPPPVIEPTAAPVQAAPESEIAPESPAPLPAVAEPEATPSPVEPPAAEPKPAEPKPAKVSAAAEASLRAFLEAPDWASRAAHVLSPESVSKAMESYSHIGPDGPTAFKSIFLKQSHIDEKTGNTLFIFYVVTDKFPDGMPVAVKETSSGWLVDWPAFIEFRDDLFEKFVAGPVDKSGVFHLIVTKPEPVRAATTENESFASILLRSPLAGKPHLAFVRKNSEIFDTVQTAIDSGQPFSPVLEVVKLKTASGQPYFEVRKIAATDWFPRETASNP